MNSEAKRSDEDNGRNSGGPLFFHTEDNRCVPMYHSNPKYDSQEDSTPMLGCE